MRGDSGDRLAGVSGSPTIVHQRPAPRARDRASGLQRDGRSPAACRHGRTTLRSADRGRWPDRRRSTSTAGRDARRRRRPDRVADHAAAWTRASTSRTFLALQNGRQAERRRLRGRLTARGPDRVPRRLIFTVETAGDQPDRSRRSASSASCRTTDSGQYVDCGPGALAPGHGRGPTAWTRYASRRARASCGRRDQALRRARRDARHGDPRRPRAPSDRTSNLCLGGCCGTDFGHVARDRPTAWPRA